MKWIFGLALTLVLAAPVKAQEAEPAHTLVDVPMMLFSERMAERVVQSWQLRDRGWFACAWAQVAEVEQGENVGKTAWALNSYMRQDGPVTEASCPADAQNGILVFVDNLAQAQEWSDEAVLLLTRRPDLDFLTFVYGSRKIRWSSREIDVPATLTFAWMETNASDDTR